MNPHDYTRSSTRPDLRPLVVIQETNIESREALGIDLRGNRYRIDLSIASGGVTHYPIVTSRWYIGKIGDRWVLSSRFGQQNPQLDPSFTPTPGETYIGGEGTTYIIGDLEVLGSGGGGGANFDDIYPIDSIYLSMSASFDPNVTFAPTVWTQLQDRFLVGAGGTYAVAATGGATTHTLSSGNLASHTHDNGTLVNTAETSHTHGVGTFANAAESSHTHGVGTFANAAETAHTHGVGTYANTAESSHTHTGPSHTHGPGTLGTNTTGAHTHTIEADFDGAGGSARYTIHRGGGAGTHDSDPSTSAGNHSHTFTGATAADGTGASGAGSSHNHTFSGTSAAGSSHNHTISGSSAAGSSHNHTFSGTSAAGSSHNHTISGSTGSTGSGTAVNHLPPYLAVYMWRRTS